jgi:hypothetical protein
MKTSFSTGANLISCESASKLAALMRTTTISNTQPHSAVTITAEPGRIIIESVTTRPSLDDMLAHFDPSRHGGEAMAFPPVGKEVL